DWNGSDSFTYHANDGTADSNVVTVDITVTPVNDAPVAVGDSYSTAEDTTLTIAAPGVLTNDTDVDGDPLDAVLDTDVSNGTLTLNADGSFTYVPDADWNGSDSFTYHANDGTADSNVVTVDITVTPVNDAPVATGDSYSTTEDTTLTVAAPGVLVNDTDVDGDPLDAVLDTDVSDGTLTLNADGSFEYIPDTGFSGFDSFTYHAFDGVDDSNVATVILWVGPVNDPPTAVDDSHTTDEDTTLTVAAPGVLANDTDPESDPLFASLISGPSNGALILFADGSFEYVPDADWSGTDSFTYQADDTLNLSNIATVTITVTPVNDAPVAVADSYSTAEDTTLTVGAPGVLVNDTDVDGDPLDAVLDSGVSNGTLTLNSDGSFVYVPDADWNGSDSFTYHANDGTADSNIVTVDITVTPVNDAPVANDDAYSTDEDTPLMIAAPGVLGNDTDADGDMLLAVVVDSPAHGALTLSADGSFEYTPDADYNGPDSFTYRANDGTVDSNLATVDITVGAVNDAPVAVDDAYSTDEDTALTVAAPGVLGNDTDIDGDPLTAVLVLGPTHGTLTLNGDGSFTYTPDADYNGPDSFTYQADDGADLSNVATVDITVDAVNDAPVAADDAYSTDEDTPLVIAALGVLGNDTDVEGDPLSAFVVDLPAHGTLTLDADGGFTYVPDADWNGSDSFTYHANDGTVDSNLATVDITVDPVNDAPVAADDAYSVDEDGFLVVGSPGVLGNDTDVEGDPLTATLVDDVDHGTLVLSPDGSFIYVPDPDYNGPDSFTYVANDGTADSNLATVDITVDPVNDAPVAVDDIFTTDEDTPLVIAAPGVLGNDIDIDGDALTAVTVDDPMHGTLALNADGGFTYTPDADWYGTDTFTYRANDGVVDSNNATVTITVDPVNDAPVAVDDTFTTDEDTPLVVGAPGVLGNDTDIDGDPLSAFVVDLPTHGTLALNADGSFTYTSDADYNGPDSFTYVANDGEADSNVATVDIAVDAVNDAPVAVGDSYTTAEDTTLTVAAPGVLANDSDVDGDPLDAVLDADVSNGTLTLNADGSFTYVPDADWNGSDSFTYHANDGTADSNVVTVDITVTPVNDAPVAVGDSYTTAEGITLTVAAPGVLGNDTDVDGDPLTAVLADDVANGALTLNADGSFTYVPDLDWSGSDSFTYRADDGAALSNLVTVSITVTPANDAHLTVTKVVTSGDTTAVVGSLVGYRITVTNDGGAASSDVTVSDTWDAAELALDSADPTADDSGAGWADFAVGPIGAGLSEAIDATFTVLADGTVGNTV
ncbi:MAG: tandem-95 repeat protein, partial [Actinobacteria bacterium]